MKTTFSISAIALAFSLFTAINGECLSGRPNQLAELEATLKDAGLVGIKCRPGYIGLDCDVYDKALISKLSCYLRGKPGKHQGKVFMWQDDNNTGKWCDEKKYPPTVVAAAVAQARAAPAVAPAAERKACPLATDIQKCVNKCVDDAIN
ncbi:hypothetical protein BB561_004534 [Smittium simulii]|uniref:Uncharacterized protein n=1 Tax=Smittium simulii TaxID=133385 RepID=A0A2T9YFT6_9FUNG|nr:hypothetical protein BB561_005800 [Smittium simulii]PVU91169.1 hypothetical protein BB561_004534 [Smittium simulii]